MPLVIAPAIDAVITAFDHPGPLDVGALTTALSEARQGLGTIANDIQLGVFAETAAWHFSRADSVAGEPWGLYWTPVSSWVTADDKAHYAPDVADVNDGVLAHWAHRANTVQHPLMVARYADLAWEIGRYLGRSPAKRAACAAPQTTIKISVDLPRQAIDGYLAVTEQGGIKDEHAAWHGLSRALMLATLLSDAERITTVKKALFAHFGQQQQARGETGHMMWWRLHDIIERSEKALLLSPEEHNAVTGTLRQALNEHSDPASLRFDPHQAEHAANRLMKWAAGDLVQQQQIVQQAGKAFEHAAEKATAMLANSWLEDLIPRYRNVNLADDVARIEKLIRSRSSELHGEMTELTYPFAVTKDEMEDWADHVAGSSREEGLKRLTLRCLLRPEKLKSQVLKMKDEAPLSAWISVSIISADGFTDATIGSVDSDMEGRSYRAAADHLGFDEPFVHAAFQRIEEKHGLSADDVVTAIMASPFVSTDQEHMLRVGLEAWKAGDAIKAIHVLVPQVEAAYRGLLSATGVAVRRRNANGSGSKVIGFGEVLDKPLFKTGSLKDVGFHLRALYTDPRALNLRNKLAHGLAHGGTLNMGAANLIAHSLLLLTLLVKKEG